MSALSLFHRGRIKNEAENSIIRSGAVQKLVLKGSWDERRWNDRWLEIHKGLLKYQWFEGGDKPIDTIAALNIPHVACIIENASDGSNVPINSARNGSFKLSSVLDTVCNHLKDHSEELGSCFYLKSQVDDGTFREYVFRVGSPEECKLWVEQIRSMIVDAKPPPLTLIRRFRNLVHSVFHSRPFQVLFLKF
jgi:hypothetical protein